MRVFAKHRTLPALVHCAHGKDRTGVVIMLLLMACDVPHEAIVQDYVQVGGQTASTYMHLLLLQLPRGTPCALEMLAAPWRGCQYCSMDFCCTCSS